MKVQPNSIMIDSLYPGKVVLKKIYIFIEIGKFLKYWNMNNSYITYYIMSQIRLKY